jgi:hypothetical protein
MKKRIFALAMALTMAVATTAFAADNLYTASNNSVKLSGTITASDLTVKVVLPTAGALTLKPFGKTQVDSGALYVKNGYGASDADAIAYDVSVVGYTATSVGKGEVKPTLAASSTFTGTKKDMYLNIELGAAVATSDEKSAGDDYNAQFATGAQSLNVAKISEADYSSTNSTYTKATTAIKVTLQPAQSAPVRVSGSMNTAASWEADDGIAVTPVFSVTPNVAGTTQTATTAP